MRPRLKIRSAKFHNTEHPALSRAFQMDDAIGITYALATIRSDEECRSLPDRELKERLSETPIMKRVSREISDLAEPIDKDACRLAFTYPFGNL